MSRLSRRSQESFNDIDITPLTDIFLVLLIIMMIVAPLLDQQGLSLMVPSSEQVEKQRESKIVTIAVSKDGEYNLDGNPVSEDQLVNRIQEASAQKKDGLLIQASGDASHGSIVKVMDAARSAGVNSISVAEQ